MEFPSYFEGFEGFLMIKILSILIRKIDRKRNVRASGIFDGIKKRRVKLIQ